MKYSLLVITLTLALGCDLAQNTPPASQVPKEPPQTTPEPLSVKEATLPEPASPEPTSPEPTSSLAASFQPQPINICSFNIQFLGNSKKRDNAALAKLVSGFDIVVVQELVAPPVPGTFPDRTPYKLDAEAKAFFDAMQNLGFAYVLSEEDTGSGKKLHVNGSSTEWWITFYKPNKVQVAPDLPGGYLAENHLKHPDYKRVPYAFPFRSADGSCDFVLISVHLPPDSGPQVRAKRKHELKTIASWIDAHDECEKDFIILGDMNIEDAKELTDDTPAGFLSLNDECRSTNTQGTKPYDHVMYRPAFTSEIDPQTDMQVIDLVEAMKQHWNKPEPYPGTPYNHDKFRAIYSDHHPVWFRILTPQCDDDGTVVRAQVN